MNKPTASPIEVVLFDLDGTLLDTLGDLNAAVNATAEQFAGEKLTPLELRPLLTGGSKTMLGRAFRDRSPDDDLGRERTAFLDFYRQNIAVHTTFFPGMAKVLASLEQDGLRWGIVTNKHTAYAEPLLHALSLYTRAACVVCGDTTPSAKPHPAPLVHAARLLAVHPRHCVYVGDAPSDIIAGRRAGMATLAASYGYLPITPHPGEWGADGLVDEPLDVLGWVRERAQ